MSGIYIQPAPEPPNSAGLARPGVATLTSQADYDGRLAALWTPPGGGDAWITRIRVNCDVACTAWVYFNSRTPANLITGTYAGGLDEYDAAQPIWVPDGTKVLIVWDTQRAVSAHARIEYVR